MANTPLPSFAEIVHLHQGMVYSIAFHALQNTALAEELAQDVFLSLHENLSSIESPDHLRHWLRRTAANRAIDQIRRLQYRRGPSIDEIAEPASILAFPDPLLSRQLRQCILRLPPLARLLTILRYQEDLAPQEIAAQLNIPVNTVKSRLHRALQVLRGQLQRPSAVRTRA